MRIPVLPLILIASFPGLASAGSMLLAGSGLEASATLRASRSSVADDRARARDGKAVARWHGVAWRSRLEFLKAGGANFGAVDRISLWIHSGTMRGESLTLIASEDADALQSSFYFRIHLTWEGWYRTEIPLIRFGHSGPVLWPRVKSLHIEYDGRKERGEIFLDDVRLLAPGESAHPSGAPPSPPGKGKTLDFDDFEKGPRSLIRWVARSSQVELSEKDEKGEGTVMVGKAALRWFGVKKGSSLEYIGEPFSLSGYNQFRAWVFLTRGAPGDLFVALGNNERRFSFCDLGRLEPGWNEVVLPLDRFETRGRLDEFRVAHVVFLYEGSEELTAVLDALAFVGPSAPKPHPGETPDPTPPTKEDPGLVKDREGNVLVAGEGMDVRPEASDSSASRTEERWYTREGRRSIRWFALRDRAELRFPNLPSSPDSLGALEAWIYSDAPAGTLEIAFEGSKREASTKVKVDWIGWKRIEIGLGEFGGIEGTGRWTGLVFRFTGREGSLREFFFDRISLLRK